MRTPWVAAIALVFLILIPICGAETTNITTKDNGLFGQISWGNSSPASLATELGKYKQYVRAIIGSYWYPDVNKHYTLIPKGTVQLRFTVHSDGTVTDVKVVKGNDFDLLKAISTNAVQAPAPFKPFSDSLIKEAGKSYTDTFTFTIEDK